MSYKILSFILVLNTYLSAQASSYTKDVLSFLDNYCIECHDDSLKEGDVSLEDLVVVTPENAAMWSRVWEVISLKKMPPPKKKKQPDIMDRHVVSNLITNQLNLTLKGFGGFKKVNHPKKANHIDHDLLFNIDLKELDINPASSPARIWRIQPQEQMVRLNDLMSRPKYDPKKPYARTRGDMIVPSLHGDVKVFYGMENYIFHVGHSIAKQGSAQGFPAILSVERTHGLRNYAHMYSVNGSEAIRLNLIAEKIIRYMAYGPETLTVPENVLKDKKYLKKAYKPQKGNPTRGTPKGIFYDDKFRRPNTPINEVFQEEKVSRKGIEKAIVFLFKSLSHRSATKEKIDQYTKITLDSIKDLGREDGLVIGLSSVFLDPQCLFRKELVQGGNPDRYGRIKLQGEELMLAINSSFSYIEPNDNLRLALNKGRLKTTKDVEREVRHILENPSIRKPKILQFFREYFDYDLAPKICKDDKELAYNGIGGRSHVYAMNQMVKDTDVIIEMIIDKDKQVLKELLTTDQIIVGDKFKNKSDNFYNKVYYVNETELEKAFMNSNSKNKELPENREFNLSGKGLPEEMAKLASNLLDRKVDHIRKVGVRESNFEQRRHTDRSIVQFKPGNRKGILTHPAWLISHSDAMDNHAIHRGIWILERLIGKAVPDVPITVDAMLPDEPHNTLRERMRVTREKECWSCHQSIDPLGLTFEMFNHIGQERNLELGKPINATGEIIESGDPALDGHVKNAIEMIEKLSNSVRVEQVFVRHVFRFWMGRNETLDDAPILREAHRAYRDSDGSFNELLVSLLTSDAFLYRKI